MHQKCKRQPMCMELQIRHEMFQTKPKGLFKGIDKHFIQRIENQEDPSKDYRSKMRGLYSQQLQRGLMDFDKRRSKEGYEKDETQKQYRQKVNGILGQLQKNQSNRKLYYKNCQNKQEQKKKRFVDEDKIKTSKVNEFTTKNYDQDYFYHGDEIYKEHQKILGQQRAAIIHMQTTLKQRQRNLDKENKKIQEQQRKKYEDELDKWKRDDAQRKRLNQSVYFQDLAKMVEQKKQQKPVEQTPKPNKHNPITNPIQYHIDNPYILKKMQNKYSPKTLYH